MSYRDVAGATDGAWGVGAMTIFNANDTDTIETYTVPETGEYEITATGAAGGVAEDSTRHLVDAGAGATVSGDFELTAGQVLDILIGTQAANGQNGEDGGGGGGTFVVKGAWSRWSRNSWARVLAPEPAESQALTNTLNFSEQRTALARQYLPATAGKAVPLPAGQKSLLRENPCFCRHLRCGLGFASPLSRSAS
jgi:hypothetical protein